MIGKPAVNVYLPLQDFPNEGDVFTIKERIESVGNISATAACLLSSWKVPVHFTGVVGNDSQAEKIRNTFNDFKVNQKFVEINFEKPTSMNFITLNSKSGKATKVVAMDNENLLKKYKYDFIPELCIMDGTDSAGDTAFLNNNISIKSLFFASVPNHETITNAKRSSIVVCSQTFAEGITKTLLEDNVEAYIDFYQKIVDVSGNSNYIVILNNHKILYSVDNKVKMLPEMKMNVVDSSSFNSVFFGAFAFCVVGGYDLDDSIKLANTAAALSLVKIGEVNAIPKLDDVLDNCGLRDKLGLNTEYVAPAQPTAVAPLQADIQMPQPTAAQPEMTQMPAQETNMFNQPAQPVETNMFDNPNV